MASLDILNLDCFTTSPKKEKWYNGARGFSILDDGQGMFNGGIVNPQREHLKVGQNYFRLVSASAPEDRKTGGVWWMDYETLNNIYQRFKVTGPNTRMPTSTGPASSSFREWLALAYQWNKIEEIVIARLEARLDCYSGFGRPAKGGTPEDFRAFGYAPHLSKLFEIKQLCVPELYAHRKKAFPGYRILPFATIEQVASGRL